MIGKKFGRWTVLYKADDKLGKEFWHCKSDIGTETDIATETILSGALEKESPNKTGRFKDITGKQNGRLTVLAFNKYLHDGKVSWLCQCECGNTREVRATAFNQGKSTSCGCSRNKPTKDCKDLIGKKFGRWTVLGRDFTKPRTSIYLYCTCECSPDVIHSVNYTSLKLGMSKSCGCYNSERQRELHIKDLVGHKFDRLEVIEFYGIINNNSMWYCLCDCGNICIKSSVALTNGFGSSCGKCPKTILTGRTFGLLHVKSYAYSEGRNHYWNCECSCKKHTQLICSTASLLQGRTSCGCDYKNISYTGSKGELEVRDYVLSVIDIEPTKANILDNKEIDLYYSELNTGIEYNGSVYHASNLAVHKGNVLKDINYHRDKFIKAKELDIHLITIFDIDWENNRKRIEEYLLNKFSDSKDIYINVECTVCKISADIARDFADIYNVHGADTVSEINYGLFHFNELVSIMSFKQCDKYNYVLTGYSIKTNVVIIGGLLLLLNEFESEHDVKILTTYSDNDYDSGADYSKLGFSDECQLTPSFYWYHGGKLLTESDTSIEYLTERFPNTYQDALDNHVENIEDYILTENKVYKVYRSGTTKWKKEYGC